MSSNPQHVVVQVPATSANLGPGYDCLGVALTLHNRVEFTTTGDWHRSQSTGIPNLNLRVSGVDAQRIPKDERNLVYQTAAIVFERTGRWPSNLSIEMDGQIPVGSGLGSSSAAVVAGLLGANALVGNKLSEADILQIAAKVEGHPDNVAPAILGGLVLGIMSANGAMPGQLTLERLETPPLHAVVVLPEFYFPTSEARSVLPQRISREDAIHNAGRMGLLVHALTNGNYAQLKTAMDDRLHQPYRLPLIPGAAEAMAAAYSAGASGVALSGAGPSLIAFAEHNRDNITAAMKAAFANAGLQSRDWQLQIETSGAQLL